MALDPDMNTILELLSSLPPAWETPLALMRGATLPGSPPGPAVAEVIEDRVPTPEGGVKVRIYKPFAERPHPCVLFMHGGGFVVGSLDTHDATCRLICAGAGALVISVDYRLAPEARFPAAPDDALAALRWLGNEAARFGGDPNRIAVAGDSAGGNLAAVTALRVRDEGGPALRAQLLIYPATDHPSACYPSMTENREGYFLTKADMDWFVDQYFGSDGDIWHPHFAVLRAKDHSGLPPALVITAQYDPLRDEGEAYGEALRKAGVPVTIKRFDGVIHGFFAMPVAKAAAAQALAFDWLKEQFAP